MPNGYEGYAALGDVIAGGASRRSELDLPKYQREAADSFSALEKARMQRARALAQENAPAAHRAWALKSGMSPEAAELGAVYSQLGENFNSHMGGSQKIGDMEMDRQMLEALKRGDHVAARNLSAVKTDSVLPELGAGGKIVFSPVDGEVELTPLGSASADSMDAMTANRLAATETARARTEKLLMPQTPRRSKIQERAATADEDMALIEREIGRKLSGVERADYLQGKAIKLGKDGSGLGDTLVTEVADSTVSKVGRSAAEIEGLRMRAHAKRAIADGKPVEAVRKRLVELGYSHLTTSLQHLLSGRWGSLAVTP
jgi:hypothetical protein